MTANGWMAQRSSYRVLGLVGQGQFGKVYCAVHRKTSHLVALKHLNRERLQTHQFLRELRFLLSLKHPNIVQCHTLEHTPMGRQLVLSYCEGGTLRSVMEQGVQLTLDEILTLLIEVLSALEHAHSQGIVHCDIKPENILLSLTADGWRAKVSDFGIARFSQDKGGRHSGATGSPAYMAPERFYFEYSAASDLYAVAVVFYELLVGDRPFSGGHAQLLVAHLNHPVKLPAFLPEVLRQVIAKGLEKLKARRFKSASEMKSAMVDLRQTLTPAQRQVQFPPAEAVAVGQYRPHQAIALQEPCHHLLFTGGEGAASMLLAAGEQTLYGWPLVEGAVNAGASPQQWSLAAPIQQVANGPTGAVILAGNTAYRLLPEGALQPLVTFCEPVTLILSGSRWLAGRSLANSARHWLVDTSRLLISPAMFEVKPARDLRQSIFLDASHLLIVDSTEDAACLRVLTRRGRLFGNLKLQTPIGGVTPGRKPYQLLAQGGTRQQDLLVITLKPLRVMRCRWDFSLTWLGQLAIGYVGISQGGQLSVNSLEGLPIGRVDNLPPPTAIAFAYPHYIGLATNEGGTPRLHCIDSRTLDLDIIF